VAFRLTKWYVDVVTPDGRVAIAYWSDVTYAGAHHAVCGLVRAGDRPPESSFSLRAGHAPRLLSDRLVWRAPSLGLDVSLLRLAPDVATRLLDTPDGAIDWMAWGPAAEVRIAIGDEVLTGSGYAERIDLGVLPWAIPMTTLRWGRWISGSHWATWIVWEGAHPLRIAWLDGVPVPAPEIGEDRVVLGADATLALGPRIIVTDASIGEQLTSLSPLSALIDRVARSHQTRWLTPGVLTLPGGRTMAGSVIHEVVRWR
jgi:hypothetical protein